ncbi:hypothetical protein COV61_00030 [Candidatus Micrarchaeota archaeon CG11_big_fil_rev_8_21_14_0_20_47_5]|nr:MAG: hypothetical protein AUJ17_05855 [Candidatus Micrarchaeota archaeon CG1_02_47_40]PIN84470.1 MAG: hypothetical protein COV61_00030 [Candidatus Micrarchaeota archaeon CG11_big_fil_rev_8_21_14_0_20_47_5]
MNRLHRCVVSIGGAGRDGIAWIKKMPAVIFPPFHPANWKKPRKGRLPVISAPLAEDLSRQKPAHVPFFRHGGAPRILSEQQFLKNEPSPFAEGLEKQAEAYNGLVFGIASRLCEERADEKKEIDALRMIVKKIRRTVKVAHDAGEPFLSESLERGNWSADSLAFLLFDVCRSLRLEPRMIDTPNGLFVANGKFVIDSVMLQVISRKNFDAEKRHVCRETSDAVEMQYLHHMHIAYAGVKGDFWGAVREADRAAKLNPNCACAQLAKAMFYGEAGDFRNALACYNKALEIAPEEETLIHARAVFFEKFGCFEDAAGGYMRLARAHPENFSYKFMLYYALKQLERLRRGSSDAGGQEGRKAQTA